MSLYIPPDDVWDDEWDAPATPQQWAACKWLYEDRKDDARSA